MPRQTIHQESFSSGEVSEKSKNREDIDLYYSAMDKAENVIVQATGGVTRRPGMEYIDTIKADPEFWKENGEAYFQLIDFQTREQEKYLAVVEHNGQSAQVSIYREFEEGSFVKSVLDGIESDVYLPYSPEEIDNVKWTQRLDTLILLHENHQPVEIKRIGQDQFTAGKLVFEEIPQVDFEDSESPSEVNEIQRIDFDGMNEGDPFDLELNDSITGEIKWSNDNKNNAENMQTELRRLGITSENGIFVTVHDDGNDIFQVDFTGNDGAFDWEKISVKLFKQNGSAAVRVEQEGESGREDAWSDKRGWPKSGTFHQGRLYLGGTTDLPETIWGSKVNEPFDFGFPAVGDDPSSDGAIQATINSDSVSGIEWIYSGRNLLIGTGLVEYYVPNEPITPSNFSLVATTRRGSTQGISPVGSNGYIYHVPSGGNAIRELVFDFQQSAYTSNSISTISEHLIRNPRDISIRRSKEENIADNIFTVNENGNVAVTSLMRNEDVIAFTEMSTNGRILQTTSSDFSNYFATERRIPEQSTSEKQWIDNPDIPKATRGMGSAYDGNSIHIFGGIVETIPTTNHYSFNLSEENWQKEPSVPEALTNTAAAYMNGEFYVGGGQDSNFNVTDKFYKFNGTNWEELNNLPIQVENHSFEVADGDLYLISNDKTYQYDEVQDDWFQKTQKSSDQTNFATAVYEDEIYLMGGEDSNGNVVSTVKKYDPSNDSWTDLSDMNEARTGLTASVVESSSSDLIWTAGGGDSSGPLATVEQYNISSDQWSYFSNMDEPREGPVSASESLTFHVMGGSIESSFDDESIETDYVATGLSFGEAQTGYKMFESQANSGINPSDSIVEFDLQDEYQLENRAEVNRVEEGVGNNLIDVQFSRDGKRMYYIDGASEASIKQIDLWEPFDTTTLAHQRYKESNKNSNFRDIDWDLNGSRAFVVEATNDHNMPERSVNSYDSNAAYDVEEIEDQVQNRFISYDNVISIQWGGVPRSVNDGKKLYVLSRQGTKDCFLRKYDAEQAYDLNSIDSTFGLHSEASYDFEWGDSGNKFYEVNADNDELYQYSSSEAYNTHKVDKVPEKSLGLQDSEPYAISFKPDGTKMYEVGVGSKKIYEYNLSTAWDISTATFNQSIDTVADAPTDLIWNDTGSKMYVSSNPAGQKGGIFEWEVPTNYDISSAQFPHPNTTDVGSPESIQWDDDGSHIFVFNSNPDQASDYFEVNKYSVNSNYDIPTDYDTGSLNFNQSINTQDSNPMDVYIDPNGTELFEIGNNSDNIHKYSLSTAFDISTATLEQTISTKDATPTGIVFNDNGEKMFTVGKGGNKVYEYDLSTGWDLTTASFVDSISTQSTSPEGLEFNSDGSKLYVVDSGNANVEEYDLSTTWDISTASFVDVTSTQGTDPRDVQWGQFGTKMFTLDNSNGDINEYETNTPFDTSAVVFSKSANTQDSDPTGIRWAEKASEKVFYEIGSGSDNIYQYDLVDMTLAQQKVGPDFNSRLFVGANPRSISVEGDVLNIASPSPYYQKVYKYTLPNNYDISSVTEDVPFEQEYAFSTSIPEGFDFDQYEEKLYIANGDGNNANLESYSLDGSGEIKTASLFNTKTISDVNFTVEDITWDNDGGRFYVLFDSDSLTETSNHFVREYTTAFNYVIDKSSAQAHVPTPKITAGTRTRAIFFRPNGERLHWVMGQIYQSKLTDSFDISTATTSHFISPQNEDDLIRGGISFSNNGTKMFETHGHDQKIYQYDLDQPYQIWTASLNKSMSTTGSEVTGIAWNDDGSELYELDNDTNTIYIYTLDTPFDLDTANQVASFDAHDQKPRGITIENDNKILYEINADASGFNGNSAVFETNLPRSKSDNEKFGAVQPVYHLERLNDDHLLDSSTRITEDLGKTISGLDYLKGETVDVHVDGFYEGKKVVNQYGEVILDSEPEDYVEIGYDMPEPTVRLLKPALDAQGRQTISDRKKRIVEIDLQLLKTKGLAVNGNAVSFRELNDQLLGREIQAYTGNKEIDGIAGWDKEPQIEITQPSPQPMTLLGVIQVVTF